MTIANVFIQLPSHSRTIGTIGQNNLLSLISILQISVEAHHQVPCQHHSMGRPIANGRPDRPRSKTDRQKSSKTDKFTCLSGKGVSVPFARFLRHEFQHNRVTTRRTHFETNSLIQKIDLRMKVFDSLQAKKRSLPGRLRGPGGGSNFTSEPNSGSQNNVSSCCQGTREDFTLDDAKSQGTSSTNNTQSSETGV
jgi:hypothetical protein